MKGTTDLLYFGEGIGTGESYLSLSVPETGDYRIVAVTISKSSANLLSDEGAMLWIQGISQNAPASCGASSYATSFFAYQCSSTYTCCPYDPNAGLCGSCGNFYAC